MKIVLSNPSPVVSTRWISTPVPTKHPVQVPMGTVLQTGDDVTCVVGDRQDGFTWVHTRRRMKPAEVVTLSLDKATEKRHSGSHYSDPPKFTLECSSCIDHADPLHESITFDPESMPIVFEDPVMRVHEQNVRLGRSLCARLFVYRWAGQISVEWELLVTASNPTCTAIKESIRELYLSCDLLHCDDAGGRGYTCNGRDLVLVALGKVEDVWDGQSIAAYGRAMPKVNAVAFAPLFLQLPYQTASLCLDWQACWGPEAHLFGDAKPEELRGYVVYRSRKHADAMLKASRERTGNLWAEVPYGLSMMPGVGGDQQGFGLAKLGEALIPGEPVFLIPAKYSAVYGLACRPVLHLEEDGTSFEATRHPQCVLWSERVHWHPGVSPDRLGKGSQEIPGDGAHGWHGADDQHFSPLFEIGAYVLTGSWMLRFMLDAMAKRRVASQTYPSKHPHLSGSTNDMNTSRAIGRTIQAMRWLGWALPERSDMLEEIIVHRVDECVAAQWSGFGLHDGMVRPLKVEIDDHMPFGDQTYGSGWRPVFDAMGLAGVAWAYELGAERAESVVVPCLKSLLEYGFEDDLEPWWGIHMPSKSMGTLAPIEYNKKWRQWGEGAWGLWIAGFLLEIVRSGLVNADTEAQILEIVHIARKRYIVPDPEGRRDFAEIRIRGAEWIGVVPSVAPSVD